VYIILVKHIFVTCYCIQKLARHSWTHYRDC